MQTTPACRGSQPLLSQPAFQLIPCSRELQPETLLIVCTDRVLDRGLLSTLDKQPVVLWRSPGPIVPPLAAEHADLEAAIDHALHAVGVREIAVCGHLPATVLGQLLRGAPGVEDDRLLYYARATLKLLEQKRGAAVAPELTSELVEQHVLLQLANLRTYPAVAAKLDRGELSLHAWLYDANRECLFGHAPGESPLLRRLYQWGMAGERPKPFLEPQEIYLA